MWYHVLTGENLSDLGSSCGSVVDNESWRFGPEWSSNRDQWSPDITLEPSAVSNAEAKTILPSFLKKYLEVNKHLLELRKIADFQVLRAYCPVAIAK